MLLIKPTVLLPVPHLPKPKPKKGVPEHYDPAEATIIDRSEEER